MALTVKITHSAPILREFAPVKRLAESDVEGAAPVEIEETPAPVHLGWSVGADISGSWGSTSSSFEIDLPDTATNADFEQEIRKRYAEPA
jgi:hypothetical protein